MARISKEYSFEAAHRIPGHPGKCKRLHGHSYKAIIEVTDSVRMDPQKVQYGMVIDYDAIDAIMKPIIEERLDHWFLNVSLPEISVHTAEMIAAWIFGTLHDRGAPAHSLRVEVRETAKTTAQVTYADWLHCGQPRAYHSADIRDLFDSTGGGSVDGHTLDLRSSGRMQS